MDTGKDFVEKIEELVNAARTVKVGGLEYSAASLRPVLNEPEAAGLEVFSLDSLCEFYNKGLADEPKEELSAVVTGPACVSLMGGLAGMLRKRSCFVKATIGGVKEFSFGRFLDQESFAIEFRSLMQPKDGDDSAYVLSYTGRLRGGTTVTTEDDGITQTGTVSRGVSGKLLDKETVKPIVRLSPYRTFRELEQPESEFLFRVKLDGDGGPKAALFEADGGAWRLEAMRRIKEYIAGKCPGLTVL
ncbi:MAG: hypothetical protein K6G18_05945 [Treponema sp.]|nr:hypothetical protein [Treponema sp.]